VNHHLLGQAWVSHTHCIDNPAMIVQLGFPRAGIQVLGQSPDSGESVQRYDYSPAAVGKKGVTSLLEQAKMKLLDSIHHFAKIILLDGVLHLGQSGFEIV